MIKKYSKITKIVKKGKSDVLDFTVKDTHRILANNFYTSNCSIKHPDSEDFIDAKMEGGKVTGANVSIKAHDDFMKAVVNNEMYKQQYPIDSDNPSVVREVDAKKMWEKVIHNAWKSAEPGVLFWDKIISESLPDRYADLGYKTTSTNPCIIGDTLIAVADGRNAVSIRDLVKEGKDVPVYSVNPKTGQREIKWGRNPRLTKEKAEVWKLTLDDDSVLIATPDHKILTKNLEYVNMEDLKKGDSLNPFYSFESNNYRQISSVGQKMVGGAFRNRRQYRIIHEFYSNDIVDSKQFAIHHKDFDSKNDSFNNLEVMLHEDHRILHSEKMIGKNNPYHKMTDEWKYNFASKPGESNPMYIDVSNEKLIEHGEALFKNNGKISKRDWIKYAKENNLPQHLSNEFRFGSFTNFKNQVCDNHKVKSVEFYGYEDVYNITVDDNHNYDIITSTEGEGYITSSGITVKNCGEIPLCPDDSCRLLAINLLSYVNDPFTKKASFNFELFKEHAQYALRMMDDIIDLEIEKIDRIIEKIKKDPETDSIKRVELDLWKRIQKKCNEGRRTGVGITAEGDMLAAMGLTYGTKKATKFATEVHRTYAIEVFRSSMILAKERGTFKVWDPKREENHPFLLRIKEYDEELYNDLMKYGRRNIACLTIAPTGCLVSDSVIKTDKGDITMGDLFLLNNVDIKDYEGLNDIWIEMEKDINVFDVNGNLHKINKLYWNGMSDTIRLKYSDGTTTESTHNHKFLVKLDENRAVWKRSDQLNKGDKVIKLL